MFALFAAAAAQTMTPASTTDPDLLCMATLLYVVGEMDKDPKQTAQTKTEVSMLLMYFYGRLDGRRPGYDIKGEIEKLIAVPDFAGPRMKANADRCVSDVVARGEYLRTIGKK